MNVGEKNSLSVSCAINVYQPIYKGMFAILPLLAQPVFNESPQSLSYPTANSTHSRVPKDNLSVSHSNSKGFVQNVHYRKITFQQVPLFLTLSTCESGALRSTAI